MFPRNLGIRLGLLAAALCLLVWAAHPWVLNHAGAALVNAAPPRKADLAIVLAGDAKGDRVLRGGELVRDGFVPKALVSGPNGHHYDAGEADLAIDFAVHRGFPSDFFIPGPHESSSTLEEARALTPVIRHLGARRVLLVTSDYHTARAYRIWRRVAPDLEIHPVAARTREFIDGTWWHHREGRKSFFFELVKTVTSPFGI